MKIKVEIKLVGVIPGTETRVPDKALVRHFETMSEAVSYAFDMVDIGLNVVSVNISEAVK